MQERTGLLLELYCMERCSENEDESFITKLFGFLFMMPGKPGGLFSPGLSSSYFLLVFLRSELIPP